MKKTVSLSLVLTMLCLALCGCGNTDKNDTAADVSALDALEAIWNDYPKEDRFSVMGGDYETPVENVPGANDIKQVESMEHRLGLPAEEAGKIDEAASLVHLMNTNTFSSGAFHVTKGTDTAAFAQAIAEELSGRRFLCGWPEKLVILTVASQTVISVFGAEDLVNEFVGHAQSIYADALIIVEQSLLPG